MVSWFCARKMFYGDGGGIGLEGKLRISEPQKEDSCSKKACGIMLNYSCVKI